MTLNKAERDLVLADSFDIFKRMKTMPLKGDLCPKCKTLVVRTSPRKVDCPNTRCQWSGKPYGARPHQQPLFINRFSLEYRRRKLHTHGQDVCLCIGGSRGGKCLLKGTPVIKYDGSVVPVEEVRVGDLLMGPDSKPRKVLSLAHGYEDMYKIVPNKGDSWTCNESHILSLQTSGFRIRSYGSGSRRRTDVSNGAVVNISVKDYLAKCKKYRNAHKLYHAGCLDFPKGESLKLDPYFLGVWLGDGTSLKSHIHNAEPEIGEFLRQYAGVWGLGCREVPRQGCIEYMLTNSTSGVNALMTQMREYDLIGNKHIPHQFKTASVSERLELLAGLVDTDGHLSKGRYFEITQKNERLADDIVFVARSLGFAVSKTPVRKGCMYKGEMRTGTYFRINIYGRMEDIPVRVPRKKCPPLQHRTDSLKTGFTIEPQGPGEYFGFTLDGDSLFLLGDFTVAHNSAGVIAVLIDVMLTFPGVQCIVGARRYDDLKDTIIGEIEKLFTIKTPWDHPLVDKHPNEHFKKLRLTNGSLARFIHFEEFERLRGRECDFALLDEASQMRDAKAFFEMIRRSSGTVLPVKQFLLSSNPPENENWLHTVFALRQFHPDYQGPKLTMGALCECQFCHECLNFKDERVPYEDGACPECDTRKEDDCDGNQEWFRVIQSNALDNDASLKGAYIQNVKGSSDKATYELYGLGKLIELRKGKVFRNYSQMNILPYSKPVDFQQPISWTHDFNISFECSQIIQCFNTVQGQVAEILDEIVLPESGPQAVAAEFCRRYDGFRGPVLLFGDHNGLNKQTDRNERHKFQIMVDYLVSEGFDARLMVKRTGGKILIPVTERIDKTNLMFMDDQKGVRRTFINPHCLYSIRSFQGTKYADRADKVEIDKSGDDRAALEPTKLPDWTLLEPAQRLGFQPPVLSHPGEAYGYWVVQVERILRAGESLPFITISGEARIEMTPNGIRVVELEDEEVEAADPSFGMIREMLDESDSSGLDIGGWGFNPF